MKNITNGGVKMKKFLQVFLVFAFLFLLAACNNKDDAADVKLGHAFVGGEHAVYVAAVAVKGDKIVDVFLDELYFFNEDQNPEGLAGAIDGKVLGSKRANSEIYTELMKIAGSKQQISKSYDAIEAYCVGKTIKELEDAIADAEANDAEDNWDFISGSTLTSNIDYLKAIVKAAKAAK